MHLLLLFVTFISVLECGLATKCESFENVKLTVHTDKGDSYQTEVTGCIKRQAFDKVITEVYIKEQEIPRLGRDSVINMARMKIISFDKCNLQTIAPTAFRNVPRLRKVRITSCELSEVEEGVFNLIPELELLRLNNNKIRRIEDLALANLENLQRVYINNNALDQWKREWFTNSTDIRILDFQHNSIKELPANAFSTFKKLKEVNFNFNEIRTIHPNAFAGSQYLDFLGLKYNRLKFIDHRMFPNKIKLRFFMLGANYLNYLPKELFEKVTVSEISLEGNPLKCSCLYVIDDWLFKTNATTSNSSSCKGINIPICSFNSNLTYSSNDTCVESIDDAVTSNFLNEIKDLQHSFDKDCVRVD